MTYGIRLHVITRDTAGEAWAAARALLGRVPPGAVEVARERFARTESEGQRPPNRWAGFGLVRPGAGTALAGSHTEVAARIASTRP